MKTSSVGLELIAKWEGTVYKPYKDVAGLRTIGVGHLITSTDNFPDGIEISHESAMQLLASDVSNCETAIEKFINVPLNQNQFDALVSFGFNCGTSVYVKSSVCIALNSGNYEAVPHGLLSHNKTRINGVITVVSGLTNRRKEEGDLFARPLFPQGFVVWDKNVIIDTQTKLKKLGLYVGLIDGIWGPSTDAGLKIISRSLCMKDFDSKYGITREVMEALDDKAK